MKLTQTALMMHRYLAIVLAISTVMMPQATHAEMLSGIQSLFGNQTELTEQEKIEQKIEEAAKDSLYEVEKTNLRKDYYLNREFAIHEILLNQAKEARQLGEFDRAKALYERVLSISPNNQYAMSGLEAMRREKAQVEQLLEAQTFIDKNQLTQAQNLIHQVLLESPQHTDALRLKETVNKKMGRHSTAAPQLKSRFNKPISLELRNANIKLVFDTLSRDTGINFILDNDIKPDTKANIFVKNLPIEEAIDMVISSNGLEKKVISENSVIIYPNNAVKKKAYEELLIRNFYLSNTKAKDVAALLKSMIKTKDIYVYERLNMLVMRDRPEVISLAEKLVSSIDIEDPEVMLEIEVLEVSRNRLQELGIVFPNQLSVLSADTALTLQALKNVNSANVGVSPSPAVNFRKSVGDLNLLSNPRIRVKNNEKAKILVGDKIPVITTTSTANVGISESVSYVDVGLKLEVEPRITLDNFVNIKVGLEVSTLGDKTVTANGATVYAIGTRNTQTALRLQDGETQILAGLILDDERKTVSKLPGLGDIPLLGRLFSNNDDSKSKTEIVLAITPRVIGNITLPNANNSEYWSGTANQLSNKMRTSAAAPVDGGNQPSAFERLLEQRRQREAELNNSLPMPSEMVQPVEVNPMADPNVIPVAPNNDGNNVNLVPNNAAPDANAQPNGLSESETFIPGIEVFK